MKTILRLVLLGVLFGSCTATWAQSAGAGTISGTVTDTSNAIISNASVTITNTDTGASRTLTANDAISHVETVRFFDRLAHHAWRASAHIAGAIVQY